MQLISFSQEFLSFVLDDFDPPFVLTKDAWLETCQYNKR